MWLSLFIQPVDACAGLFHETAAFAESDNQQVILRDLGGEIEVSYNVLYEGNAEAFGWVIPIFGEFSTMEDGDSALFEQLSVDTSPEVNIIYNDDGGRGGCTRSKDMALGSSDSTSNSLDIVAEGFTGSYSYSVIEASSADLLEAWLTDNGWSIESSLPAIEAYVAEGGVQFVAISLTDGVDTDAAYLPPVTIRYAGDQLRFPATMARYGMSPTLRTTIFVLGEQPATVSGWSSATIEPIEDDLYYSPESLFEEAVWGAGGESPGYLLTYAGGHAADYPEAVVTRFDAFASSDAHTVDSSFALDGEGEVRTVITLTEEDPNEAWLLLPLLAGCGMWRRRRVSADSPSCAR